MDIDPRCACRWPLLIVLVQVLLRLGRHSDSQKDVQKCFELESLSKEQSNGLQVRSPESVVDKEVPKLLGTTTEVFR